MTISNSLLAGNFFSALLCIPAENRCDVRSLSCLQPVGCALGSHGNREFRRIGTGNFRPVPTRNREWNRKENRGLKSASARLHVAADRAPAGLAGAPGKPGDRRRARRRRFQSRNHRARREVLRDRPPHEARAAAPVVAAPRSRFRPRGACPSGSRGNQDRRNREAPSPRLTVPAPPCRTRTPSEWTRR